jgi:hypothetical protein
LYPDLIIKKNRPGMKKDRYPPLGCSSPSSDKIIEDDANYPQYKDDYYPQYLLECTHRPVIGEQIVYDPYNRKKYYQTPYSLNYAHRTLLPLIKTL